MPSTQEQRHVYYDRDLEIEAYNLGGIVQKFPNHFHEFYVLGFIEGGKRHLWCRGKEYDVAAGDLILFNPRDNHYCAPINGEILDYRAVNINPDIMRKAVKEITGRDSLPRFTQNVVPQSEIAVLIGDVYDAILSGAPKLKKAEAFYFLIEQVLQDYAVDVDQSPAPQPNPQIQSLCEYIETHCEENITLENLAAMAGFGQSYLLRCFTQQVGVSPYHYLQTIRIDRAKKLLEQGVPPMEAAVMTGFADQSHFTNYFKEFIGLTPKQYQRIFTQTAKKAETEDAQ